MLRLTCAGSPAASSEPLITTIEIAHAMAPGARIIVYTAPSSHVSYGPFGGFYFVDDILHDMAHPPGGLPRPNQNSDSFLGGASDTATTQNLPAIASLGGSFFVASGDGGAYTGTSLDMRTFDYVTVVGGTNVVSFGGGMPPNELGWTGSGGGFFGPMLR